MRIPRTSALESISRIEQTVVEGGPIARSAVERARSVAQMIERAKLPMPFVFPTEIGGIQFEWKGNDRELDLEVLPDQSRLAFLKIVKGVPAEEGEINEREVESLLEWVTGATA